MGKCSCQVERLDKYNCQGSNIEEYKCHNQRTKFSQTIVTLLDQQLLTTCSDWRCIIVTLGKKYSI